MSNYCKNCYELTEQLDQLKAENETLKSFDINLVGVKECEIRQLVQYRKTLTEIIRFFKEDNKFARYSGYPIIFTSSALENIEKILKENDIKISECEVEND